MMVRLSNHMSSPLATEDFEQVDTTTVIFSGKAKQDVIEALSARSAKF